MVGLFYDVLRLMESTWFVHGTWLAGFIVMFLMVATTGWKMKLLGVLLILICSVSIVAICLFHFAFWPAAVYAATVILVCLGVCLAPSRSQ